MPAHLCGEVELLLIEHFYNAYFPALVLPTINARYLDSFQSDMWRLALASDPVRCSLLAGCAANRHMLSRDPRFRTLALRYYAEALGHFNSLVQELKTSRASQSDALMCSVTWLYTFNVGCLNFCRLGDISQESIYFAPL